jgi:hypothetical protein
MTAFLGNSRPLWLAATVVALFVSAPNWVRASCGEYVSFHAAGNLRAEAMSSHRQTTLPIPPCHGPNCSRAPKSPLVPTSIAGSSMAEEDWNCDVNVVALSVIPTSSTLRDSHEGKRIPRTSDIFHPPR